MIKFLDKKGNIIPTTEIIELSWNRKYKEAGGFTLYMPLSSYNQNIKYIQLESRPETGVVQKLEYIQEANGKFVILSGYFLEKLVDSGASLIGLNISNKDSLGNHYPLKDQVFDFVKSCLKSYLPFDLRIPFNVDVKDSGLSSLNNLSIKAGTPAGKALYGMLGSINASYYCEPIFKPDADEEHEPLIGLGIRVYKGDDKRDDICFGSDYGNVSNVDYSIDESNAYPLYHVLQKKPAEDVFIGSHLTTKEDGKEVFYSFKRYRDDNNKPSDMGNFLPRKVIFSHIDNIAFVPENANKILDTMDEQAKLDMLNNYKEERLALTVIQNRFKYGIDYDLGDVCSVSIPELKKMFVARIVCINETYSNNKLDVQIVLGTPNRRDWRVIL